jgi:rhodanese-related sulfurtransferase
MKKITTEQLEALREDDGNFVLIDVLQRPKFEQQHIPGSVNAPFGGGDFVSQVESQVEGDKSKKVVVYCGSIACDASLKAAHQLEQAGFTNVYRYEEGVEGWSRTGHQVEAGAV